MQRGTAVVTPSSLAWVHQPGLHRLHTQNWSAAHISQLAGAAHESMTQLTTCSSARSRTVKGSTPVTAEWRRVPGLR